MKTKVVVSIGGASAVCFIISYIAFHNDETFLGWLFLSVGLVVALAAIFVAGRKR